MILTGSPECRTRHVSPAAWRVRRLLNTSPVSAWITS
jgi:hypothetical protein